MSHFTVMVVTKDASEEALKSALQPFHEYECTGEKDEYVVFVDEHDEVVKDYNEPREAWLAPDGTYYKGYENQFYREPRPDENVGMGSGFGGGIRWSSQDWGDGRGYRAKVAMEDAEIVALLGYEKVEVPQSTFYGSLKEFAEEYHGYDMIKDGRIGRYTNPNAKWDWWQVGGRWSGKLRTKTGQSVDEGFVRDLDFDTARKEAEEQAAFEWDRAQETINGRELIPFEVFRKANKDIDKARELYWAQPVLVDLKDAAWTDPFTEFPRYFVSREDYIANGGNNAVATFAFLGTDGVWRERGEMGWWACVSNEDESWGQNFPELLAGLDPDDYVHIVDCHI